MTNKPPGSSPLEALAARLDKAIESGTPSVLCDGLGLHAARWFRDQLRTTMAARLDATVTPELVERVRKVLVAECGTEHASDGALLMPIPDDDAMRAALLAAVPLGEDAAMAWFDADIVYVDNPTDVDCPEIKCAVGVVSGGLSNLRVLIHPSEYESAPPSDTELAREGKT
jgi:hypothetical protein